MKTEEIYEVSARTFGFNLRRLFKDKDSAERFAQYLKERFDNGDPMILTKPKVEISSVSLVENWKLKALEGKIE